MPKTCPECEIERDAARSAYRALQLISELIGVDTSNGPAEGVFGVVLDVERYVRAHGGTASVNDAIKKCGDDWLDFARAHAKPADEAHRRGAEAYYAAINAPGVS